MGRTGMYIKKIKERIQKVHLYMALGVLAVLGIGILAVLANSTKGTDNKGEGHTYGTYVESKLADDVMSYLADAGLDQDAREGIAACAVQSYNAVLGTGTDIVTDEHSEALMKIFQEELRERAPGSSDDDIRALSSGISSYVWQAVLLFLDDHRPSDMPPDRDAEYMALAESLQEQIDALEEERMDIHITARIKGNGTDGADGTNGTDGMDGGYVTRYISGALDDVNSSMDEKISHMDDDIDKRLDGMRSEITSEVTKELTKGIQDSIKDSMKDDVDRKVDDIKDDIASELEKEIKDSLKNGKDGKDGAAGKTGKDGKDGEDGKNGKDGKDGKDGEDGKSTYIAYADDASGNGFSLTPTETSKYIGTCTTSAASQPADVSAYGSWQPYRSYVITSTTDEDNKTTIYIR